MHGTAITGKIHGRNHNGMKVQDKTHGTLIQNRVHGTWAVGTGGWEITPRVMVNAASMEERCKLFPRAHLTLMA
eukprot:15335335-Ditylum_brightwellii.AAC.1